MSPLSLREVHSELGARFTELVGLEAVADYGDPAAEHAALGNAVVPHVAKIVGERVNELLRRPSDRT